MIEVGQLDVHLFDSIMGSMGDTKTSGFPNKHVKIGTIFLGAHLYYIV